METAVSVRVAAEVKSSGQACFPRKLLDAIKAINDEPLFIEADDERVIVTSASTEFELPTQPADTHPGEPELEPKATGSVDAGEIKAALDSILFAVAKESTRYAMTGVKFERDGSLVTTDSKRMALVKIDVEGEFAESLVPSRFCAMLAKHAGDGRIRLTFTANAIEASFEDGTSIYSRLVEGRFPPWRDIKPKELPTVFELKRDDLASVVRRACAMAGEDARSAKFGFNGEEHPGGLAVSLTNASTGRVKTACNLASGDGKLNATLDPVYLLSYLGAIDADTVKVRAKDPTRPIVFEASGHYYLQMPLSEGK